MHKPDPAAAARSIAAIWRIESAKVVARVARITHDLGLAEDCAQDALVAALEHWPELGIPERPGAWLITAAKRRVLDQLRHRKLAEPRHVQLGHETDLQHAIAAREFSEMIDARLDDNIGDDLLRRPSPPATLAPPAPRSPTGRASPRCTTR
ncbi:sigma factor [Metallibacterium sp.]